MSFAVMFVLVVVVVLVEIVVVAVVEAVVLVALVAAFAAVVVMVLLVLVAAAAVVVVLVVAACARAVIVLRVCMVCRVQAKGSPQNDRPANSARQLDDYSSFARFPRQTRGVAMEVDHRLDASAAIPAWRSNIRNRSGVP